MRRRFIFSSDVNISDDDDDDNNAGAASSAGSGASSSANDRPSGVVEEDAEDYHAADLGTIFLQSEVILCPLIAALCFLFSLAHSPTSSFTACASNRLHLHECVIAHLCFSTSFLSIACAGVCVLRRHGLPVDGGRPAGGGRGVVAQMNG